MLRSLTTFKVSLLYILTPPESKANRGVNKLYNCKPYRPVGERLNVLCDSRYIINTSQEKM